MSGCWSMVLLMWVSCTCWWPPCLMRNCCRCVLMRWGDTTATQGTSKQFIGQCVSGVGGSEGGSWGSESRLPWACPLACSHVPAHHAPAHHAPAPPPPAPAQVAQERCLAHKCGNPLCSKTLQPETPASKYRCACVCLVNHGSSSHDRHTCV